ncbi:MAG TPA: LysR family transcriptional regulator [Steroidobacteraceae bacterium]|nr:LysR family transcriptional regulator [Steroidobacteraceae bacterium]
MAKAPKTSLDQWAVLAAVVDEGGFAAAGEALDRSQSAVSYAVQQLQAQLPVALTESRGRRTVLTEAGTTLLRRARAVLAELGSLEALAQSLAEGWEGELRIAVDLIFPPALLYEALGAFGPVCRATRVEVVESVLSGTTEALLRREVELAIVGQLPPGFLGTRLMAVEFVPVAHRDHALHALGRSVTLEDLKAERQIVVRDSGSKRRLDAGWLGAEQRWTVSHVKTSIEMLKHGLGFAWLPREHIRAELASGLLAPLPLADGGSRVVDLHLVYADRDAAGPAARGLARLLIAACARAGAAVA